MRATMRAAVISPSAASLLVDLEEPRDEPAPTMNPEPSLAPRRGGTIFGIVSTVDRRSGTSDVAVDAAASSTTSSKIRLSLTSRDGAPNEARFHRRSGPVSRSSRSTRSEGGDGLMTADASSRASLRGAFAGGTLARRVLDPSPCTLEIDGERAPFDRVSLVCASVVADLGLGLRLNYRAGERTDRFHVVATPLERDGLSSDAARLAGRPLRGPRVDTLARCSSSVFRPGPARG